MVNAGRLKKLNILRQFTPFYNSTDILTTIKLHVKADYQHIEFSFVPDQSRLLTEPQVVCN